jgi:cyclic-di-AMP phosphodiesterase PgpH
VFRLLIRFKRIIKRKLKLSGGIRNGYASKNRYLYKSVLILAISLIITLAYPQQLVYQPVELPRLGDIANENIVAPFDFEVDRPLEQVEKDILEAKKTVPLILDYDFNKYENVYRNVVSFFGHLRSIKETDISLAQSVDSLKIIKPGINIATLRDLIKFEQLELLENQTLQSVQTVYKNGILPDSVDLSSFEYSTAVVKKRQKELKVSFDSLFRKQEIGTQLRKTPSRDSLMDFPQDGFIEIVTSFIEPTLSVNLNATEQKRTKIINAIPYIERSFSAGELIISRNTKVDAWHITALEALTLKRIETGAERSFWHLVLPYVGRGALIIFTFAVLTIFFAQFKRKKVFTNQRFTALMLIILLEIVFVYIIDYKLNLSAYLIPFAIGAILITVLFGLESGIISTLAVSLVIGIIQNFNFSMALISFLSGTTAAIAVQTVHKRSDFYRPVLYLIVLYLAAIYLLESLKFSDSETILQSFGFGMINSILSPIIAMGILPIFESMFNITTDLTLLELSDMNHPLLRRLALEAPGTYHHSIVVGNLCEKAAEAIGANPLLARVGTYYHDIGKMEIPEYFVENSAGGKSRHDSISPHMSALIIGSHVKKGLELAEKEDLPDIIMGFIAEHHGTSLMKYFYHKAQELSGDNGDEKVNEDEYRYPGPRPQSKETAILMIADSIEAASRTLDEPKPARIKNLVRKLIHEKFEAEQLSDSELTMRDMSIMEDAFTQMLLGVFHKRVDYPQKDEEIK